MPTDGSDDPLSKPLAELTLNDLLRVGILGTDNDKKPTDVPDNWYAVRLSSKDIEALAMRLQAASAAALTSQSAASRKPASKKQVPAKKAAAKKAVAKNPAAKKADARKAPARKSTRS